MSTPSCDAGSIEEMKLKKSSIMQRVVRRGLMLSSSREK